MATFARLLRTSNFIRLGDFRNRQIIGRIVNKVDDDLYVDFGLKFDAVCKPPRKMTEELLIGDEVIVKLHDPEISQRFLGSKHDLTLLEADAIIIKKFNRQRRD
ncbi:mitochondrial ribosomal protein MRP-S35 domain-containing protein [Ditylenchus destructor]|nr:mitochondrial ribosomal protein MRP-S35 domain-containing protein [Ditylenchus destructor]